MPSTRRLLGLPASAALLSAFLVLFLPARAVRAAGGFFDDLPRKGYIRDDVSLDVLSAQDGARAVIATIRSSASAASHRASPKTSVQSRPFLTAVPLSGSKVETPWNLSTLSATAGP